LLFDISFGLKAESEALINAIDGVLKAGWRTRDIADKTTPADKILGTEAIGKEILDRI
jgi:3-isopropylmalate dehydrogenase